MWCVRWQHWDGLVVASSWRPFPYASVHQLQLWRIWAGGEGERREGGWRCGRRGVLSTNDDMMKGVRTARDRVEAQSG